MERIIKIYRDPLELSYAIADELIKILNDAALRGGHINIALSGGNTPRTLFATIGNNYSKNINWKSADFFWSDERCVPPDSPESNYKLAKETFLDKIKMPAKHIHRIKGEQNPEEEAERYSAEVRNKTASALGVPRFDVIFLGIGEDGHTASIFPGDERVLTSNKICEVAIHPSTLQKRITLTLHTINNARKIFFMATGISKAEIVAEALNNPGNPLVPSSMVNPHSGEIYWFLDNEAASSLSQLA